MDRNIVTLLQEALSQPEAMREAWIDTTCADVPQLAAELRELLRHDAQAEGILDRPLGALAESLPSQDDNHRRAEQMVGHHIGRYRLSALLGVGGMGVVYLAQRTDPPFEQTVALKLLRNEKLRRDSQARFARERRILARLSHPHIAHLIDGGFDEQGHPWLAMEYIDGEPLMSWCDTRRLGVGDRLRLLLDLCEAVEYAHRHSVIHRDIKPSNVLVDRNGTIKLLDFGIAKQIEEDDSDASATMTKGYLLTPAYAAPEQIRGEKATTATDVHALGLLLYELICGRRTYGNHAVAQFDLLQEILGHDAPPMRTRLMSLDDPDASTIAAERSLSERELQRLLRGDLHHIAAKALRKEPETRYRTVTELSDDIRRYLTNAPVLAVEGARTYRLRKFVGRHRLAVSLAGTALLSLLIALIGMIWLTHQLRMRTNEVEQQSRSVAATRDFLLDMFKYASPERAHGKNLSAIELVDIGTRHAETELDAQPELKADLLGTLGAIYGDLGQYNSALTTLRKAREIAAKTFGETSLATMRLDLDIVNIANVKYENYDQSRSLLDRIIISQRQLPPTQRTLLIKALILLGQLEFGRDDLVQSKEALREAIDLARSQGDLGQHQLAEALLSMSMVATSSRQPEGVPLLREAIAIYTRILPPDAPEIANSKAVLAANLIVIGQPFEAETLLRDGLDTQKRILGEEHPLYIERQVTLGMALLLEWKFDEAERLLSQALTANEHRDGNSYYVAYILRSLATLKILQSQTTAARPYAERAYAIFKAKYGADNVQTLDAALVLAHVQLSDGEYEKAETATRDILEHVRRLGNRILISKASAQLGEILRMEERPAEAISYLRQAIDDLNSGIGEKNIVLLSRQINLSEAERDVGEWELAREHAQAAAEFTLAGLPAHDLRLLMAHATVAQLDYLQGRCSYSSLSDLEAFWKQLERDTPGATGEIAGAGLMVGLCRRQLQGRTDGDPGNDAFIRTYIHKVLQTTPIDPFYRKVATGKLGSK